MTKRRAVPALLSALTLIVLMGSDVVSQRGPAAAQTPTLVDILITGGTVITMDEDRRVLENGAVAIAGDRIAAVGPAADLGTRFRATRVIDAARKVVMPGLIDGHGHAGHGLLKSLGTDMPGEWYRACELVYALGGRPSNPMTAS